MRNFIELCTCFDAAVKKARRYKSALKEMQLTENFKIVISSFYLSLSLRIVIIILFDYYFFIVFKKFLCLKDIFYNFLKTILKDGYKFYKNFHFNWKDFLKSDKKVVSNETLVIYRDFGDFYHITFDMSNELLCFY
ncbi:hypothetical protein IEQ34_018284 [Dendrobium chrysotoxum]|uniref:Uncharacterized protein n=1 Tax=Dendrobium chrysotoxum TaxID=161865 RepID=A0AAV7FW35_DENCH|nr:hypothetical protein IEQ34_018284 [Dendrobium chrysotoxum]